jgi:hypothetical protein
MTQMDEGSLRSEASGDGVEYIVIKQSYCGTLDDLVHGYEQIGPRYSSTEEASAAGWELWGHDDFNIGRVQGDRLIWFGWMERPIGETDEDFAEIARQLELVPDRQVES